MLATDEDIMSMFMEHIEKKDNIAPFLIDENPFQPYDIESVDPKDVLPIHGQKRGRWKELSESNACIRVPYLDKDDGNDGLEDEIMKTVDELEKTQKELNELKKNNTSTTMDKKPKRPRKRRQNRSNRK